MSFGEASAFGSEFAEPAGADCWANEAVGNPGQTTTREATITSGIRIPASVLSGRAAGRDRSLPPAPSSLPEREDNQGTGVLRHALERLAIERDKLVGHQAAPARRHGDVLLAAGHVADD